MSSVSQLSVIVKTNPRRSVTERDILFWLTLSESLVYGQLASLLLGLRQGSRIMGGSLLPGNLETEPTRKDPKYLLQGHTPKDLTSSPWSPEGSTSS